MGDKKVKNRKDRRKEERKERRKQLKIRLKEEKEKLVAESTKET